MDTGQRAANDRAIEKPKLRDFAIVGFGLTLAVLVFGSAVGLLNARRLDENRRRVAHTHEVMGELEALLSTLKDAETGHRGYLLTEDAEYLTPYNEALVQVPGELSRLKELTRDNPDQQARLAIVEKNVAARLEKLRQSIVLVDSGDHPAAIRMVRTGIGKALMDELRTDIAAMKKAEDKLLTERADEASASYRAALLSILLPALIGVALVGVVFFLSQRSIRQKQQAALATAEQKERLRTTLASIGDAVISTDVRGNVTYLNAVAQSLTGWSSDEAQGLPLTQVFHIVNESTRQPVENPAMRALSEGVIVGLANHTVLIARDGTERPIDDSAAPIRCVAGELVGCVLVFRDISERKRADAVLRENQARTLAVVNTSIDGIITIDHMGNILEFNPAAEAMFGYRREEVLGREMASLIIPDGYRDAHRAGIASYVETGAGPILGKRLELTALRASGGEFPVELTVNRINTAGLPIFTGYIRDITARRREEEAQAERTRLISLRADVSAAVASEQPLATTLQNCCEALVRHLEVSFARIWTLNEKDDVLELQASAGLYTHLDGPHSRIKVGEYKIGRIAASLKPHLTNAVPDDPNISDQAWAVREGMIAFAGYPLVCESRCVGVLGMFARTPLTAAVLNDLAPLAELVALCVDRRRVDAELRLSHDRFEAVVNSAPVGVYVVDAELRVRQVNSTARPFFGERDELIGSDIVEVLHALWPPAIATQIVALFRRTLATGESYRNPEFYEDRQDLHVREYYDWQVHRITLPGGRYGLVCYFLDISPHVLARQALEQSEERLRQVAAELSEADRRKDEFLATLAHELRNPLAPIRNGLQVMLLAKGNAEAVEQARTMMERQLGQMVHLVDDLLDVNRISRGKLELRKERVSLATVLSNAVETCRPLIQAGGHELAVDLPATEVFVDADLVRLAQVFANLLNNAAKYSERGGRITLKVERQGSDVAVSVKDAGVGIPPHMLPKIFDLFTQVDRSLEKAQGGLGIGLTLVKRLVEMHGGSVEARSEGPGRGSQFIVRLPVDLSALKTVETPVAESPDVGPFQRCRILIADDNADSATSLAMMLKIMGNEVLTASDGLQAVDLAANYKFDVILLDIGMPKLNGYEACRRIRELPAGDKIVLIAVTGWGQEEDRRRSLEAGFNHHMVKPVDPAALEKLLATLPAAENAS